MATIITAQASPTIGYQCAKANEVIAVIPATGPPGWTWQAPSGWSVQAQSPAAAVSGVTAFLVSGLGTAAPRRATWTLGPNGYETEQVVGIDESTGRPVWELDGVPTSAGVYGGAGELCVVSPFGVECLNARTGTQTWQWRPVATPGQAAANPSNGVVTAGGRLYLIAPTPAAGRINSQSVTQRSTGAFDLRVMDLATGRVVVTMPLPSYYGGTGGVVVSLDSPPGVAAVTGSEVLITPQTSETDVLEAFDIMTG
jgi:hypothetical protein